MNRKQHYEGRILLKAALTGVIAGAVVSVFRELLDMSASMREAFYQNILVEPWLLFLPMTAAVLLAFVLHKLLTLEPWAGGSGIPQVKGVIAGKIKMNAWSVIVVKFIAATMAIGAGLSLGRQGPSVQFGACVGEIIGHIRSRRGKRETRGLTVVGAGAGLAAAFNAPLAGVVFCMEELAPRLSSAQILSGIIATAAATVVSQMFFSERPVFDFADLPSIAIGEHWLLFAALGVFCGLLGVLFNRGLLFSLNTYDRIGLRGTTKLLPALFLSIVFGYCLPQILGGGDILVDELFATEHSLHLLFVLLVGKYCFTLLCFGSGVPGGIFLPMLAIGAIGGAIFGELAIVMGIIHPDLMPCCIIFGMAGCFTGAVKAPVSSSILIMELTGSFEYMLPLLLVSFTACIVLDMTATRPIYGALLQRNLHS